MEPISSNTPMINMDTSGLSVDGLVGTWHAIDHTEVEGHTFWLMEHDQYGENAACIIVDERGKLSLSGIHEGITDHIVELLQQEIMPVDRMPDPSISVEEMKAYGYAWGGMLPLTVEAAVKIWNSNLCPVYRLYHNDTEGMVEKYEEFHFHASHHGIFGVEKVDWLAYLEREKAAKTAAIEAPVTVETLPSASRLNQMLIYMINTYTDAVYGTVGDYDAIKQDIMSAIGMTEAHFESIKCDLDFVHHAQDNFPFKEADESMQEKQIPVVDSVPKTHLRAINIEWDVDNEEDRDQLPTEIDIPDGMMDEDEITDYLSDVTGFCHKGYSLIERETKSIDYLIQSAASYVSESQSRLQAKKFVPEL